MNQIPPEFLVTTEQALLIARVSRPAFKKWGIRPHERRGREVLFDAREIVDERLRRRSAEAVREALATGGSAVDLDRERTRLTAAQADKHSLNNAVTRGELVEMEAVAKAWGSLMTSVRAKLLSLPTKCAPEIALIMDAGSIERRLATEIIEAMREAAEHRPGRGIVADQVTTEDAE